jgi:hypothetical protein
MLAHARQKELCGHCAACGAVKHTGPVRTDEAGLRTLG